MPAQSFIFQSRLDKFDLRTELRAKVVDRWAASRYRTVMRPGDIVYLWLAGPEDIRGIYGWGAIKKSPYRVRGDDTYDVDVFVEHVFAKPILAGGLRRVPGLSDLLILRAPQATNFLLSREGVRRIATEISKSGERAPQAPAPGPTNAPPTALTQAQRRTGVFISYSHAHVALLAAASDEGAIVLAVIVSPCRYVETEIVSRFQAANPPSRPLTLMNVHEREEVFYHVSVAIEAALSRVHKAHD